MMFEDSDDLPFDVIVTTPQGWAAAEVPSPAVQIAKDRFAQHFAGRQPHLIDAQNGAGNYNWSGELGEMLVDQYLTERCYNFKWMADENEYEPDFLINGISIDVKTKNVSSRPKLQDDYFSTVRHDQFVIAKRHGILGYIFCNYDYRNQWVYLMGKISYAQFDKIKIERNVGDQVHDYYTVREKSWDVRLTDLTPPMQWTKTS